MRLTRPRLLLLAALVLGSCVAYFPGLKGPFLLDDYGNTLLVTPSGADVGELLDIAIRNESGLLRRPIPNLSFALNYLSRDLTPFNYKAFNLALHICTAFAVFLLANALARARLDPRIAESVAWTSAFLWALHPLHVSTTLYVVQRMAQFSTLFMLLSVLVFTRWRLNPGPAKLADTAKMATLTTALALLALMSKENAILVPLLLACTEAYSRWCGVIKTGGYAQLATYSLIWLPIALLLIGVAVFWQHVEASYSLREFTMGERLATQPLILLGYLKSLAFPALSSMSLFHDDIGIRAPGAPESVGATLAITALLLLATALGRRTPGLSFGVLWFFAAHTLESSVYGLELAWEHRNYLPSAGLLIGVSIEIVRLARNEKTARVAMPVLAVAILTLGSLTFARSVIFSSESKLAAHQIQHHPRSLRTQLMQLGIEQQRGDPILVSMRLAAIQALDPVPVRAHLLGVLSSCELPPLWPHIYSSLAAIRTTRFHQGISVQIEKIIERQEIGACNSVHPRITFAIVTGALQNPAFSDPRVRQALLISLARTSRMLGAGNETLEDLLIEAFHAHPRNFVPLMQATILRMQRGDADGAEELYEQLLSRRDQFDRPIGHILARMANDIAVLRESASSLE